MDSNKVPFLEWACKTSAQLKVSNVLTMKSSNNKLEDMIIRDVVLKMKKDRARYIRSFAR